MSFPQVPDHALLHPIGRGAYGEVWLARHHTLGTLRAVKVVRRADFEDERPFRREFEGIRRYEPISRGHPHLIPILHVGGDDTAFFYVMELADPASAARSPEPEAAGSNGIPDSNSCLPDPASYSPRNLRTDLKSRGHGTADEAIALGRSLAGALGHLHSHGLVHRDVKPSNVIWVHGQPKLADLGLVTDAGDSRSFVGTEGYIPPEGPGSAPADCYALGKLLYEFATGRDRHDWPAPAPDLATRPDRQRLLELNAILHRACAPRPADRYPDGTALQADLERLAAGGSVRRRQRLGRLTRTAARVALGTTFLLLLAWALSSRRASPVRLAPPVSQGRPLPILAVLPFQSEAGVDANLGTRLTEEIRAGLARVPGLGVIGRATSEELARHPQPLGMAASNRIGALLEGRLSRQGNGLRLSFELADTATGRLLWSESLTSPGEELAAAPVVIQRVPGAMGLSLTYAQQTELIQRPTRNLEAERLYWEARSLFNVPAPGQLERALEKLRRAVQLDPDFALALTDVAGVGVTLAEGAPRSPTNYWAEAKAAAERSYRLAPDSMEANLAMAGLMETYEYDWAAAERFYRRAIELRPEDGGAHGLYGLFLAGAGRAAEAREHRQKALKLDPLETMNPMNMGHQLFYDEGKPHEALPHYLAAIGRIPTPGRFRPLGDLYRALGRDQEALDAYEKFLPEMPLPPEAAPALRSAHARAGWPGYWREWLAQVDRATGYYRWSDRATLHDHLGQTNEVFECLRKSIENREFYATQIRNPNAWKAYRADPRFQEILRMLRVDDHGRPRLD